MANFTAQQKVRIKSTGETGVVAYQRMAPPDFREAFSVSVVLDSKLTLVGYRGSVFLADDVEDAQN